MKQHPVVTVLMPVYNGERFLAAAIDSVLAQSMKSWRLVVVDDGSIDNSAAVVRRYSSDPRVTLIQQANGGVARARNRALAEANSPYVALLDQDDLWYPHKLALQVAALDADPICVLSHGQVNFIDAVSVPASGHNMARVVSCAGRCTLQLLQGNGLAALTVLCRTELLRLAGGFRPEEAPADDWGAWLRLSVHGGFHFADERLGAYRVHEGNETHRRLRMRRGEQAVLRACSAELGPALDSGARTMLRWARAEVDRATAAQLAREGRRGEARNMRLRAMTRTLTSPRHLKQAVLRCAPASSRRALDWWMFKYFGIQ